MKLIHQLSKETGIPIGTLRFYEKMGLIKGAPKEGVTTNKYAYYDEEVEEKLRFIQMAKDVGFTLAEIREVVAAWYEKRLSKAAQLDVLNLKLLQIAGKIKELKAMEAQISLCKRNIENRVE
jgi:DNA-binding transcriptional MerR regulator